MNFRTIGTRIAMVMTLITMAGCVPKIPAWSSYPMGVESLYGSLGRVYIGTFEDALSSENQERFTEIRGAVKYVEDPEVQRLTEFVRAAFISDLRDSGLFEVVSEAEEADYVLSGVLHQHQAIKQSDPKRNVAAALLALPTLGLSVYMMRFDTDAATDLEITLETAAGVAVYTELLHAESHVTSSLSSNMVDVPDYHRIATLKKVVREGIDGMAEAAR